MSSSHNMAYNCNGCKSVHSKVKQFVFIKPLLCLCTKFYHMISYFAKAVSHNLQNAAVSASFICLEIYVIKYFLIHKCVFIAWNLKHQSFDRYIKFPHARIYGQLTHFSYIYCSRLFSHIYYLLYFSECDKNKK